MHHSSSFGRFIPSSNSADHTNSSMPITLQFPPDAQMIFSALYKLGPSTNHSYSQLPPFHSTNNICALFRYRLYSPSPSSMPFSLFCRLNDSSHIELTCRSHSDWVKERGENKAWIVDHILKIEEGKGWMCDWLCVELITDRWYFELEKLLFEKYFVPFQLLYYRFFIPILFTCVREWKHFTAQILMFDYSRGKKCSLKLGCPFLQVVQRVCF